mgnify:CR=1 FL=1
MRNGPREPDRHAEEIGVDVIFGYDHFHAPFIESIADFGNPIVLGGNFGVLSARVPLGDWFRG